MLASKLILELDKRNKNYETSVRLCDEFDRYGELRTIEYSESENVIYLRMTD